VASKYVAALDTDANGVVTATVQGISASVNNSNVTLIPMINGTTAATTAANMGEGLFGWICGGTGTQVPPNYLPGSCRGNL
jgi:type IV pilus assembly protein PilA